MFINHQNLMGKLQQLGESYHLPDDWLQTRPYLFSSATVTLSALQVAQINALIAAIESVVALPAYQQKVLTWAPDIAHYDPGIAGLFFGYDFHLTPTGPKLIEINSNAGSAALTAILAIAQQDRTLSITQHGDWESYVADMFVHEWQQQRGQQQLCCVAIVDEHPPQQFLHPDFLLFQAALSRHNITTLIVDPSELFFINGTLKYQDKIIDMVYNRLTDFSLTFPEHQMLKKAYTANAIVLTPHPRSHALYADKRNLAVLTDRDLLRDWGVSEARLQLLASGIPQVTVVDSQHEAQLWQLRKQLFFKPVAGYGGKGTYRGAKISRRVFNEILHSNYVAQLLTPPSEQVIDVDRQQQPVKVDVRSYVYQQQSIGMVARLYQGQVTNMRTPGGGFATVKLGE